MDTCPTNTVRFGNEADAEHHLKKTDFEPLLDSDEAAALLRIHPKTLQRLARASQIPAHRIAKRWYFRASELDRWFAATIHSTNHPCCVRE